MFSLYRDYRRTFWSSFTSTTTYEHLGLIYVATDEHLGLIYVATDEHLGLIYVATDEHLD